MKKRILNIKAWSFISVLGILAFLALFTSCEDESNYAGPISISKVYLQDAESSVPDREVNFARLGQLIRIEGSGFTDLKKVYINGFESYFNPVMVSDNSMLVSVSRNTPTVDADPLLRNTITLANDGNEATIAFEIRSSAPTITNISNTLPQAGESIMVYGTGLVEVSKVVFPGNVEVMGGIVSDEDGEFFTVTVPEGVSVEGGSLFVECANGGAYSPAYFNFKAGVILDFDGMGGHGYWGSATSMITADDLQSESLGTNNLSQGIYVPHRPDRIASFAAASNRCSEVWTAGNDVDDWRGQLTPYIPASTPLSEVAFQFDLYVPEAWSGSGFLKVCLFNAFNGGEWAGNCYNYVPWIMDGEEMPFQTEGWTTVTIPFNMFYAFADGEFTFDNVLTAREGSSYKNFGFYFENSDFNLGQVTGSEADSETEFTSSETAVKVYTDNWRVVSLAKPVYTDFPEEGAE